MLAVCVGVFIVLQIVVVIAAVKLPKSFALSDGELPSVSVLVTCRNEAQDLQACVDALAALDYPIEKLEVVLVDDRSTDSTPAIIGNACRRHPQFAALKTTATDYPNLKGKARGIALAARHARGEWLFITDADAIVPPGWLRHMLSRAGGLTGLIGGGVLTVPEGLIGRVEAAVSAFLMPYGVGARMLSLQPIPSGPNMAIRRDVYVAAGGLEVADFQVAEDLALAKMAHTQGFGAVTYSDPETIVSIRPVPTLLHLFSQHRRWLLGGKDGELQMFRTVIAIASYLALVMTTLDVYLFIDAKSATAILSALMIGIGISLSILGQRVNAPLWKLAPILTVYFMLWWPILIFSIFAWTKPLWRGDGYSQTLD